MCLENLHHHSDDMEYRDHTDFSPGLEPSHYQKYLESDSCEKEKIISIYNPLEWIGVFRENDHEDKKESKNTGICLSVDEDEKVMKV